MLSFNEAYMIRCNLCREGSRGGGDAVQLYLMTTQQRTGAGAARNATEREFAAVTAPGSD